jgi:SAM-dependent methyltransferase
MAWFKSWFDSPYYPVLYSNRNTGEARLFLDNMLADLSPVKGASVLDIGCGRGRHSIYLNKKGFDVTGVDVSSNSIDVCKPYENDTLHFFVHNMRDFFRDNCFDLALNLFTSFGYFENESDNAQVINNACRSLKKGGRLVIDFMNSKNTINNLVAEENKSVDSINFHIKRVYEKGVITKTINFAADNRNYEFFEKIHAYSLDDFNRFFKSAGLELISCYGDYNLNKFDINTSPRMILTCIKH